jgi:hypothetical protein
MPVYLDEEMVGVDQNVVAFPHLLVCMGVVCMTERNLYGIHLTNVERTNMAMDHFVNWLGSLGVTGNSIISVYGSANLPIRYQDVSGPSSNLTDLWKTEMNRIAGKLGYRGPIYGFDTSILDPKDGTYVEYQSQLPRPTCRIFYKRNEKVAYTAGQYNGGAPNMAQIQGENLIPVIIPRTGASVIATKHNQGLLHEVDYAIRLMSYIQI